MKYLVLPLFFLLFACQTENNLGDIDQLNGFWEIEKAETPYGAKKYEMNQSIDFIKIEDSTGFRKKLKPSVIGNYTASKDQENFDIKVENDSIRLYYSNSFDEWKETIIDINENKFVVKNEQDFIYTYKRHERIDIEDDGKK